MSLVELDRIIQLHLSTASNIPTKIEVKNAFNQSMVIGPDETVNRLKTTKTWEIASPILQKAIGDMPIEENPEIAGRIFNVLEKLYPEFITNIAGNAKKVTHAGLIVTKLIQEIRNA